MATNAFREGFDDAMSELRCGAWSRATAINWLAETRRREDEYSLGFDSVIQALADGELDLGDVVRS